MSARKIRDEVEAYEKRGKREREGALDKVLASSACFVAHVSEVPRKPQVVVLQNPEPSLNILTIILSIYVFFFFFNTALASSVLFNRQVGAEGRGVRV